MGHTSELDSFLNLHKPQLTSSGIPEIYWETIDKKIKNQIFNAGEAFQLLQIDYEREREAHEAAWSLQTLASLKKSDPKNIFLIDHAWTFRIDHAKNQLFEFDSLRQRLCSILGINENLPKEEVCEKVFYNVWKLCRSYSIGNAQNIEDRLPVWYVMDEIGSAVMHSDSPNVRIVPFVDINTQITYSLLFPVKDIEKEEFIYADFAEGINKSDQRAAALLPWVPQSFKDVDFEPECPGSDYYLSGHESETLPDLSMFPVAGKKRYTVYTQYDLIKTYLTNNSFEIVETEMEADILWLTQHFKNYASFSTTPHKFVNQFPFEFVLTVKDLLCLTCRKFSKKPDWFPITYNLQTEITNFVSYFQHRERENLENFWIVKPYNLARGLDIHITNNLNYIMRLPVTGPKIVQKYITNPVLFYRAESAGAVKFDIRYVILLKSVKPLKAFIYKHFFLRFANKPFELTDFHIYEKHFTVMNYNDNVAMKHMLCEEFCQKWEEQYSNYPWKDIETHIFAMLKQILECAVKDEPPCGIAHSPQSRALYAADLMLEWTEEHKIQPKILEINWTPDCRRACEYYPDFYNNIFELLFLSELPEACIEL